MCVFLPHTYYAVEFTLFQWWKHGGFGGFCYAVLEQISDKECSAVINIEEECSTGSF